MSEFLDGLKDYVKSRFGNPFFSTLILVWFILNWDLWYALFTFDKASTQLDKISYISNYFQHVNLVTYLAKLIGITFGILIGSYLLLALSKFLQNVYEDVLIPMSYHFAPESKKVPRTRLNELNKEINNLTKELDAEREARIRAEQSRDKVVADNAAIDDYRGSISQVKLEEDKIMRFMKTKLSAEEIKKVNLAVQNGSWAKADLDNPFSFLQQLGVIQVKKQSDDLFIYEFTTTGQSIFKRIAFEDWPQES